MLTRIVSGSNFFISISLLLILLRFTSSEDYTLPSMGIYKNVPLLLVLKLSRVSFMSYFIINSCSFNICVCQQVCMKTENETES